MKDDRRRMSSADPFREQKDEPRNTDEPIINEEKKEDGNS